MTRTKGYKNWTIIKKETTRYGDRVIQYGRIENNFIANFSDFTPKHGNNYRHFFSRISGTDLPSLNYS